MEEYNSLSTADQQTVYTTLELLGEDLDGAWSTLKDNGIDLSFTDLAEISAHFSLV